MVPDLRISLQKGAKGSKAFERNSVLDRKSRSNSNFFLIKTKHGFVFLARESVYALAFSAVEMLKDTCKQKSIFPLGYEASADGSGSLQGSVLCQCLQKQPDTALAVDAMLELLQSDTVQPILWLPWRLGAVLAVSCQK